MLLEEKVSRVVWKVAKLATLTVFTFILKAEACDYGKGRYISMFVMFGQSECTVSAGQSEQTALVGRRDFVENEAERRGIEDLQ